jgi:hypothetical protein
LPADALRELADYSFNSVCSLINACDAKWFK